MTDPVESGLAEFITARILKQPNRRLSGNESLISSGLINSFSLIDLALFVEDTFWVVIADSELNSNSFDTLEQLAKLIRSRQSP